MIFSRRSLIVGAFGSLLARRKGHRMPLPPDQAQLQPGQEGITLLASETAQPIHSRVIEWVRESDGSQVARIAGVHVGTVNGVGLVSNFGPDATQAQTQIVAGDVTDTGAQILLSGDSVGQTAEVDLLVRGDSAQPLISRKAIDQAGRSDFVQALPLSTQARYGIINANGTVGQGVNLGCVKNGVGDYSPFETDLTYSPNCLVVCVPINPGVRMAAPEIVALTPTAFRVQWYNLAGAATDTQFMFWMWGQV